MSFAYKTNSNSISKIEFTGNPEVANIAFKDPTLQTVLVFGVPAATASAIAVVFFFGPATPRDLTIYTKSAPTKAGGNAYAEAQYDGRAEIS